MAALDPRRSSRALRATQSQSQVSSTSSSSSGRAERATRAFNKGTSPQKSTPTASLSSEPPEDSVIATEDTLLTRRRTRGQADDRDRQRISALKSENVEAGVVDEIQEDDEAVRCLCGFDEYPGPPPIDDEPRLPAKSSIDHDGITVPDVTDDMAGFFVQCDICKVWQHGACVGIMTEESSPEEYFCEQCHKESHKIFLAKNGQRYSHYLPLTRPSRSTSRQGSQVKDVARSPRERETRNGRMTSSQQIMKRRSTMNSREAGYDEAEALRRAIEASKEEVAQQDPADGAPRRPKRGRSDSEGNREHVKRQRTMSRSVSPSEDKVFEDSDDAMIASRNGTGAKAKPRSAAIIRSQRADRVAERDEKERQKAEQARKRASRMERRRADDSDPSEEIPLAAARTTALSRSNTHVNSAVEDQKDNAGGGDDPPASDLPSPDTPPANVPSVTSHPNTKNSSRSHKKRGRNQYTVNREGPDESSPARSQSRDLQKNESSNGHGSGNGKGHGSAEHSRAGSKPKGMNSKVTMADLKRRAGAILDFISRTQLELAGEASPGLKGSPGSSDEGRASKGLDGPSPMPVDGKMSDASSAEASTDASKDFKDLSCLEMMDSLTGQLVKWQQEFGS